MTIKITDHYKLESAVTDGLHDAVCLLKSCQLLHETQLPQSECAMLRATTNGWTCRASKLPAVWQVDAPSTLGGVINKLTASVHR